mgnify:CR=1 FL=1
MYYQKILVAINIYEDYEHVVNSACAVAHKVGAKIDVITVIDNTAEFVPAAVDFQKNLQESQTKKSKLTLIKKTLKKEIFESKQNFQQAESDLMEKDNEAQDEKNKLETLKKSQKSLQT